MNNTTCVAMPLFWRQWPQCDSYNALEECFKIGHANKSTAKIQLTQLQPGGVTVRPKYETELMGRYRKIKVNGQIQKDQGKGYNL